MRNAVFVSWLTFLSQKNWGRFFKWCCLIAGCPRRDYHTLEIDLSCCAVSSTAVFYTHFIQHTLVSVWALIAESGVFRVVANNWFVGCVLWWSCCFVEQYNVVFEAHLARKKRSRISASMMPIRRQLHSNTGTNCDSRGVGSRPKEICITKKTDFFALL